MKQSKQPFLVVEKGATLWKILASTFGLKTDAEIADKVKSISKINPHLKNPDQIKEGQVIFLGSSSGVETFAPAESDLKEMEVCFRDAEQKFLIDNWEVLSPFAEEKDSFLDSVAFTPATLKSNLGSPENVVVTNKAFSTIAPLTYRAGKAAAKTGALALKGQFGNLTRNSKFLWSQLEGEIVRGLKKQVQYLKTPDGPLRLIPANVRPFNLHGKIILVSPTGTGYQKFSKSVKLGKAVAKNLKRLGTVTKFVDFGLGVKAVKENWNTKDRERTIAVESTKFGTALGWSAISEMTAAAVCGGLTLTTGAGGIACFGSVFLIGGVAMSGIAETIPGFLFDKFEKYLENEVNSFNGIPWLYKGNPVPL